MDITAFMQTGLFNWVVMPLVIIIARLFDVSLSTIRIVFTARGEKRSAAITGFFEVFLWLIIIKQIIGNISNPLWYVSYAAGYAFGTYLGLYISEKLSIGRVIVRIITAKDASDLVAELRSEGLGVTVTNAEGKDAVPSKIIFSVINTKDVPHIVAVIKKHNPKAFYTIEDVRKASRGYFRKNKSIFSFRSRFTSPLQFFSKLRK